MDNIGAGGQGGGEETGVGDGVGNSVRDKCGDVAVGTPPFVDTNGRYLAGGMVDCRLDIPAGAEKDFRILGGDGSCFGDAGGDEIFRSIVCGGAAPVLRQKNV